MADFTRTSTVTLKELSVDQNTCADTMTYIDHHQVAFGFMFSTIDKLTNGIGLAVVDHTHRQTVAVFDQASQGQILPIKIDSIEHHTFAGVDQPGGRDTNANHGLPVFGYQLIEDLKHSIESLFAIVITNGNFDRFF